MKRICPLCNRTYEVWQKVVLKTGTVPTCKRCGVPLVPLDFYESRQDTDLQYPEEGVRCPRCGLEQAPAEKCAACGTPLPWEKVPQDEKAESPFALFKRPGDVSKAGKSLGKGAAIGLLLIMLFSAGTFFFGLIYSEPYKAAKAFIRENKQVRRIVGEDLSFGLIPTGTIKKGPNTGYAKFIIKVKGNIGSTNVTVELTRNRSGWKIVSASCEDRYGKPVRLVRKSGSWPRHRLWPPAPHTARGLGRPGNQSQPGLSGSLFRVVTFSLPVSST